MNPYYYDDTVWLYQGDCREVLPALGLVADLVLADPPYVETTATWDHWPTGWVETVTPVARSMWVFGTLRMFMTRAVEFKPWHMSHDIVWDKGNGTSTRNDRFRSSHELAAHWYHGALWRDVYHDAQYEGVATGARTVGSAKAAHFKHPGTFNRIDDGRKLILSVMRFGNLRGRSHHQNEKPVGLLDRMVRYGCPEGGIVVDPFAGSGSTAVACRMAKRQCILIERGERECEVIAKRMDQDVLDV